MWYNKPHDTTNKEYLYLYMKDIVIKNHLSSHSQEYRSPFKIVYDDVISSFVFCFGSDAHKIIQYLFLCFVWFIYVALWNKVYPPFFLFLYCVISGLVFVQCRIGVWKSSFSLFTRLIAYLSRISYYSQIISYALTILE